MSSCISEYWATSYHNPLHFATFYKDNLDETNIFRKFLQNIDSRYLSWKDNSMGSIYKSTAMIFTGLGLVLW